MLISSARTYERYGKVHRDLTGLIASLGSTRVSGDIDRNMRLMRELSAPMYVASLLAEIMSSTKLLREIAARSYRHVNHFDKLVLVESQMDNGYRLTLHLWSPPYTDAELQDELIHDHRFSFWSAILVGRLRTEEFRAGLDGVKFNNYRYSPDQNSEYNNYMFQGPVCLERSENVFDKSSEVYYLAYDTTHRVLIPSDSMTCTMVLRSPRARTYSNVYNTVYPSTDTSNENYRFGVEELRGHLYALYSKVVEQMGESASVLIANYA